MTPLTLLDGVPFEYGGTMMDQSDTRLSAGARCMWWVLSWLPGPAPTSALAGLCSEAEPEDLADELAQAGLARVFEDDDARWVSLLAGGDHERSDSPDVAGPVPDGLVREGVLASVGERCLGLLARGEVGPGLQDEARDDRICRIGLQCLADAGDLQRLQQTTTSLLDGAGGDRRRGRLRNRPTGPEVQVTPAELIQGQRELGHALSASATFEETLSICLEHAISQSGMDCGGVYLVDEASGNLDLVVQQGLSPAFAAHVSHHDAHTPSAKMVLDGKPIYAHYEQMVAPGDDTRAAEKLKAIAVIPVLNQCAGSAQRASARSPSASTGTPSPGGVE